VKILFLTEFFPKDKELIFTGGVEARIYYIVSQAQKDFELEVISSHSSQIPATPISLFTRAFYLVSSFLKALRRSFDLIEGSNVVSYLPAYFAGRLKHKKVIAWIPDVLKQDWFQFGLIVGLPGYLLEKISLRLNWDRIIALSRSTKAKLIAAGVKAGKISVIHGGVDLQEFAGRSPKKFTQFTIICVARLVATKRVVDLVRAFSQLARQHPRLRLIIVGYGPKKSALTKLTTQLGLAERISFRQNLPRQDLIKLLRQSHLFCLPSVVEGFGLVTLEAMAAGLPAVLADIPINREICPKEKGVIFFPPRSGSGLAKAIERYLSNRKLYAKKQQQAMRLAKKYDWQNIYQQTQKLYLSTTTNY
jgi:glycosyltransferase involved in cell wall biosynthesis